MKKYFIVADVHGFYDELMTALNEKGFDINNPDHIFVSLGDLCDRGTQPFECLDFVLSLPEDRRLLVLGNHELLMEEMVSYGAPAFHDMTNGTYGTAEILTGGNCADDVIEGMKHCQIWKDYLNACEFYHEVGDNIFVHGWIPIHFYPKMYRDMHDYNPLWRECGPREWKEATWLNGMEMWADGVREPGKTIWCGHWHTSWGHANLHHNGVEFIKKGYDYEAFGITPVEHFEPFKDEGIVAMDACTAYTGFINCEVIEMED